MTAVLPGHDSATGLHALADREMLERPSPKKARPSTTETDLQLRPEADDSSGKEKLGLAALIGLGESEPNVQQPSPTNKISKASFEAHKKAERKERNRLSAERHRKKQREHTENLERRIVGLQNELVAEKTRAARMEAELQVLKAGGDGAAAAAAGEAAAAAAAAAAAEATAAATASAAAAKAAAAGASPTASPRAAAAAPTLAVEGPLRPERTTPPVVTADSSPV